MKSMVILPLLQRIRSDVNGYPLREVNFVPRNAPAEKLELLHPKRLPDQRLFSFDFILSSA